MENGKTVKEKLNKSTSFPLGKPQKKVIVLMAGPLRPYPPSGLMAIGFFFSL